MFANQGNNLAKEEEELESTSLSSQKVTSKNKGNGTAAWINSGCFEGCMRNHELSVIHNTPELSASCRLSTTRLG